MVLCSPGKEKCAYHVSVHLTLLIESALVSQVQRGTSVLLCSTILSVASCPQVELCQHLGDVNPVNQVSFTLLSQRKNYLIERELRFNFFS